MELPFNQTNAPLIYSYEKSPLYARSFQIFKHEIASNTQTPVATYTVLDTEENLDLSEKKVMNIITLLNGGKTLMALGEETQSRLLFHIPEKTDDNTMKKVIFYTQKGEGVSKENAILTYEEEVFENVRSE